LAIRPAKLNGTIRIKRWRNHDQYNSFGANKASEISEGSMDIKPRPNDTRYLQVLKAMSPEQRLQKAFEMSAFTKMLFRQGLRERFADLAEGELHRLYLDLLAKCHNRNY
jgi:hypothetical protein